MGKLDININSWTLKNYFKVNRIKKGGVEGCKDMECLVVLSRTSSEFGRLLFKTLTRLNIFLLRLKVMLFKVYGKSGWKKGSKRGK